MAPLNLLIVADDPLARAGVALLLAGLPGCRIIDRVSGHEVDETLNAAQIDAIIWDVGWLPDDEPPDWSGIAAPIIALLADEADAAAVWAAGASALLSRHLSGKALLAVAQTAVHGFAIFDPALAQALLPGSPGGPASGR